MATERKDSSEETEIYYSKDGNKTINSFSFDHVDLKMLI